METNAARVHEPRQALFKDGLGTRYRRDGSDGPLDVLVLRDTFASIPSFEFLIRERINRLAHIRSDSFARVLDLEHVPDGAKLAIVSKAIPGVRLSRMLAVAEQNLLPLDIGDAADPWLWFERRHAARPQVTRAAPPAGARATPAIPAASATAAATAGATVLSNTLGTM